jgi:hypothetical protein
LLIVRNFIDMFGSTPYRDSGNRPRIVPRTNQHGKSRFREIAMRNPTAASQQ